MLSKLDRYTITECLPTFAVSLGVLSFVLMMPRVARLFDLVVAKGVPLYDTLTMLAYSLPAILPLLLPLSLLLSVLLAMGRMSADSEVAAMRSCGVSLAQNIRPIFLLSFVVAILTGVTSVWVQPLSEHNFREALQTSVVNGINLSAEAGTFTNLAKGVTLYAARVGEGEGTLEDIFIHSSNQPLAGAVITARKGLISSGEEGVSFDLEGVEISQIDASGQLRRTTAKESIITLPIEFTERTSLRDAEKPISTLFAEGYGELDNEDARVELHRRFALPVSCLIIGLLGASLGMHHSRSGKSRGILLALAIFFIYYALSSLGTSLGKNGKVDAGVAMWMPNFIMAALAIYAFKRKNTERPLPLEAQLFSSIARIRGLFRGGMK
ncbi:MAG: LPS export ABC transporter permease LptF [Deltaproteobacteria bacterium]|nr:MAG: LPS export ABC transporter permease LptF [Deltaproteobacteria bacterium]